jgi:hypothetical protein
LSTILCIAAGAPFLPALLEVARRGVPDVLFTGDGAALELRVFNALHGIQLLGPYSLFGWSHPGPAYFYLAAPFYALLGERGPALNVFALTVNAVTAVALVLAIHRLLGSVTAWIAAALLAAYILVGAPFLIANEWNPILPMLPLALLTFLVVPLAVGESTGLPIVALIASAIVQTHVGYGAPIATLLAVAFVARRRSERRPISRGARIITAAGLAVCWALPLYEAATARPGNIQWLIEFFAPDNLAKQSWAVAWTALREQAVVMPLAIVRAVGAGINASVGLQAFLFFAQCALLVVVIATSIRNRDRILAALAIIPLAQWSTAIVAVRAIRQPMAFYLVAWISVISLVAWIVICAWMVRMLERRYPKGALLIGVLPAAVLMVAALGRAGERPPVFREPDAVAEALARDVETVLQGSLVGPPLVRIEWREGWSTAVAVVLSLTKRGVPVYVEDDWLYVTGSRFAAPPGRHPELRFVQDGSVVPPADAIVSPAAARAGLAVYLVRN